MGAQAQAEEGAEGAVVQFAEAAVLAGPGEAQVALERALSAEVEGVYQAGEGLSVDVLEPTLVQAGGQRRGQASPPAKSKASLRPPMRLALNTW